MRVRMYVRMHVCTFARKYVCVYAGMHLCIYVLLPHASRPTHPPAPSRMEEDRHRCLKIQRRGPRRPVELVACTCCPGSLALN